MMTVGSPPKTFWEYFYTTFTMFFTCGIFGFVLNSIGQILDQKNQKKRQFNNDMETINRFMRKRKISEEIRVEVREYMENLYI
jgi:flagellar biosynthesis/type III secretory pathway ATPase